MKDRFTKELLTLINSQPGFNVRLPDTAVVDRHFLIELMDKAECKPIKAAIELATDAKDLAVASGNTITHKEGRMVIKGLYGYKREKDPDYDAYDGSDVIAIRRIIFAGERKWAGLSLAFRNWK